MGQGALNSPVYRRPANPTWSCGSRRGRMFVKARSDPRSFRVSLFQLDPPSA
jgi:hypothetical protein